MSAMISAQEIPFHDMAPSRRSPLTPSRSPALPRAAALLALAIPFVPKGLALDVSPPPITVVQGGASQANGYIFLGPQAVTAPNPVQGPEIVDNQGRVVWFLPTPGKLATDVRVQAYQGNPVITWSQGVTFGDPRAGDTTNYIADGTYKVIATVQAVGGLDADIHEFLLTPQNTALITLFNNVPADLSSVGGPSNGTVTEGMVEEIDVATGNVLFAWHSLPSVSLAESYVPAPAAAGTPYDYFHINSVNPDTDGNLLISSRFTRTVFKINRTTGAIIWRLGGKKSDFALGPGLAFAYQHDAIAVDSKTIRIFDNESDGAQVMPYSRVIWVSHDDTAMTATLARSVAHPDLISVAAEGGSQGLGNGDTLVDWGIVGRISEFNPAGQLNFDAVLAPGYGSYRAYRFPWVGAPSSGPTAVALQNADGTLAVHAVWNGATGVASWQVLGGPAPGPLAVVATVPWNGLDTVATVSQAVGAVQVVALNSAGAVIGTSASVSGPFAAVFPTQPAPQTVAAGATAVFNALASGSAQTYQWMLNGSPLTDGAGISGSTSPTLVISGATASNAGSYACVASSFGNSATSSSASLSIGSAADRGRLANLSCRSAVAPGGGALIIGFVVGGQGASGTVPVLIRASGPALSQFGVPGALPDPALGLYGPGGVIASDKGWGGASQTASASAMVGAFAWSKAASLDSALDEALGVGPYTAVISGASGDSGIALGELYDATPPGARLPTTPRLVNISGRTVVGSGPNSLITGFVVGGSTSETLLIRASGPALSQFGVAGALADPQLVLSRTNGDGTSTLLLSNTGWNGSAQVSAAAASVGAFPWTNAASADSALLVTLAPGSYTAGVSGASGDSGVALVEVYEVP